MARPFFAARVEDRLNRQIERAARKRGWVERVIPYAGYGSQKFVRVLARVVLSPRLADGETRPLIDDAPLDRGGWRNFLTAPLNNGKCECTVGEQSYLLPTDRNGYVDTRLPVRGLKPGWHRVTLRARNHQVTAPIMVVDAEQEFGLVSDIDDTVITTSLPRPLLAAWNTFVVHESARQAVPGMAELYRRLISDHPNAPVLYLSTGAWNTAETLTRFFKHHNFPDGALLLSDWGPTNSGWFRSGQEHKRINLRDLAIDFPKIRWILIGDDGQHDPTIYGEFAEAHPDRVRVIGLRQLSPGEQVLAHGTTQSLELDETADDLTVVPEVRAGDGYALGPLLEQGISEIDSPAPARAR
jgi:phosphatidate phosphatase APP1